MKLVLAMKLVTIVSLVTGVAASASAATLRACASGCAFNSPRGISLNSAHTDIVNSYISDIKSVNSDSQAIAGYNGTGPFRIVNNYIEGAAENILFGGSDPAATNFVSADIEIRGNHITKPASASASAGTSIVPQSFGASDGSPRHTRIGPRSSIRSCSGWPTPRGPWVGQ